MVEQYTNKCKDTILKHTWHMVFNVLNVPNKISLFRTIKFCCKIYASNSTYSSSSQFLLRSNNTGQYLSSTTSSFKMPFKSGIRHGPLKE